MINKNKIFGNKRFGSIKTIIYVIISVFIAMLLSFVAFLYTPLVKSLNIVGEGRLVSQERVMDNLISVGDDMSADEMVLRYFMDKHSGGKLSYERVIEAVETVDSLNNEVALWRAYSHNIINIINGKKEAIQADSVIAAGRGTNPIQDTRSMLDSLLRTEVEQQLSKVDVGGASGLSSKLHVPIVGQITSHFNYNERMYDVIIQVKDVAAVMSPDDGTVILSEWTPTEGFIMSVQHKNNMVSSYKRISKPLKSVGDRVSAKEVIAYVGERRDVATDSLNIVRDKFINTLELHFSLWQNGNPINPEKFIIF